MADDATNDRLDALEEAVSHLLVHTGLSDAPAAPAEDPAVAAARAALEGLSPEQRAALGA